jgi:uncharacterized protein YaaR (DUF327 family)
LEPIVRNWVDWIAGHHDNEEQYGTSNTDDGETVTKFYTFHHKLVHATALRDGEVHSLLDELNHTKDLETARRYKVKYVEYVEQILKTSIYLKEKAALIIQAGVKDHNDEIKKIKERVEHAGN